MKKYTQFKNKQKLARALGEIGLTVHGAKKWLNEAATEAAATDKNPASTCRVKVIENFEDSPASVCDSITSWLSDFEKAYTETDNSCDKSSIEKDLNKWLNGVKPESNKPATHSTKVIKDFEELPASNVKFFPAATKLDKPKLFVGGEAVKGDFKAVYTCDTQTGKTTLQVEFVDPL